MFSDKAVAKFTVGVVAVVAVVAGGSWVYNQNVQSAAEANKPVAIDACTAAIRSRVPAATVSGSEAFGSLADGFTVTGRVSVAGVSASYVGDVVKRGDSLICTIVSAG